MMSDGATKGEGVEKRKGLLDCLGGALVDIGDF